MKIITKIKEYYDYLQGIYGIDDLVVYDRRTDNLIVPFEPNPEVIAFGEKRPNFPASTDSFERITFAVCNKIYTVFRYNYDFYHTPEELLALNLLIQSRKDILYKDWLLTIGGRYSWITKPVRTIEDAVKYYEKHNEWEVGVNKALRQPVLIQCDHLQKNTFVYNGQEFAHRGRVEETRWAIPYLSKYGFASWYSPEKIWTDIYTFIGWLNDNPEIPNKQTDLEKLQAHGFDKKVSFRHRK